MLEKTLVFVKPDGVRRGLVGEVIKRIEQTGLRLIKLDMRALSDAEVDQHYVEHVEKAFYPQLRDFIRSGPIVCMVVEGEQAVAIVRKLVGETDSAKALPGTIRGDFATSKSENMVHASDSIESAAREIHNFFQ